MCMFGLGTPELVLVLVICLVLFGGKKLPELSRSVADTIKELRRAFTQDLDEKKDQNKK